MPTATADDIWLYTHEHTTVRTKDLEQEFVKTQRLSRGILYKYQRLLEAEGKIQAQLVQSRPPYNVYYIPQNFRRQVEALKQYTQLSLTYYTIRPHNVQWQDAPKDFYITPVKEKILWQNPDTRARVLIAFWDRPQTKIDVDVPRDT